MTDPLFLYARPDGRIGMMCPGLGTVTIIAADPTMPTLVEIGTAADNHRRECDGKGERASDYKPRRALE